MTNILVLEDDQKLNYIVCSFLNDNGFHAVGCLNADDAFEKLDEEQFDLIISDIMLPKTDGCEFASEVRATDKSIPILFLTALDDFHTKKKSYGIGIDDYLVKPVNMEELLLHITALLRRANIASSKALTIGSLTLNEDETAAYLDGEDLGLTVREFRILFKLLSYPKRTFTRVQLMDEFWGFESESTPRTVDVSITKLRDKLSICTDIEIVTMRGLGYKAVIK